MFNSIRKQFNKDQNTGSSRRYFAVLKPEDLAFGSYEVHKIGYKYLWFLDAIGDMYQSDLSIVSRIYSEDQGQQSIDQNPTKQ